MSTTTPTTTPARTLRDVYRERLAAADPTDKLYSAISSAIADMAPYTHETGDLRPSEVEWIDEIQTRAVDAAKEAVIATVADVFERELPRLLPSAQDGMAPPDLWAQGGDAINGDAELAAQDNDR